MACDKRAVENNDEIYLCREHRSKKLDSEKEYLLKNMKKVRFVKN